MFSVLHLGCPVLGHLWCGCLSLRGLDSLLWCRPSLQFKCEYVLDPATSGQSMITALLCLLSVLHCSGKAYNELVGYSFNAIWVSAVDTFLLVGTLFLQVCHPSQRGCGWPTAFELPQRKEAHCLRLAGAGPGWVTGWFHHFLLLSLLCCSEVIRICLLITTCFEVCHHHIKPFRQPPVEAVMLQFSYVIQ